jgi:hypothetical protein
MGAPLQGGEENLLFESDTVKERERFLVHFLLWSHCGVFYQKNKPKAVLSELRSQAHINHMGMHSPINQHDKV